MMAATAITDFSDNPANSMLTDMNGNPDNSQFNKENARLIEENDYLRQKVAFNNSELEKLQGAFLKLESQFYKVQNEYSLLQEKNTELNAVNQKLERKLKVMSLIATLIIWNSNVGTNPAVALRYPTSFLTILTKSSIETSLHQSDNSEFSKFEAELFELRQVLDNRPNDAPLSPLSPSSNFSAATDISPFDIKSAARIIKHQDSVLIELTNQIDTLTKEYEEATEQVELKDTRIDQLSSEIDQLNALNKNLMEENESYQMLLEERTMKGNFDLNRLNLLSEFQNTPVQESSPFASPQPARTDKSEMRRPTLHPKASTMSLADELGKFALSPPSSPTAPVSPSSPVESSEERISRDPTYRALNDQLRQMQSENKALGLYIGKILSRIMENNALQNVLATDSDYAVAADHNGTGIHAHSNPNTPPSKSRFPNPSSLSKNYRRFSWMGMAMKASSSASAPSAAPQQHPSSIPTITSNPSSNLDHENRRSEESESSITVDNPTPVVPVRSSSRTGDILTSPAKAKTKLSKRLTFVA
ncbi:hypothetical protein BKA69DRAFT_1149354 [Paraphysoderma sedebokerense]|nr:hypothetical protein BKA69DRAFT_1149354 [Paraphysoderma sedebokerense]